jgi:molybdopterin converting factor small subunit
MPQEIFDIVSPKKSKNIVTPQRKEKKKVFKRRKINFGHKKVLLVLIVFLIIGSFLYFFIPSEVEVSIKPKMERFNAGISLTVDEEAKELNTLSKTIPGEFIEEQNSLSQSFSSSGKVFAEKRAEGIIRVYNDYSFSTQALRANTRFMSSDGKVFRAPERVVIPGKKTEGGKEVPGYVDITVVADEAGPDYNVEPTSFSVPGLVGTALYTKIYGESFDKMQGGIKQEVAQVTQEDLIKAEEQVIAKLKEEGEKILKRKAEDSGNILLEDTVIQEIVSTSTLVEAGAEIDNFNFSAEVKTKGLAFSEEDVKMLIQNNLREEDLNERKVYDKSLVMNWEVKDKDLEERIVDLSLDFSVETYLEMSEFDIKKEIAGKDIIEAREYLGNKEEVDQVGFNKSPFWTRKVPENFERMKINFILD